MITTSTPHIPTYLRTLVLVVALVLVVRVSTAVAAASTVRVYLPHVKVNLSYTITLKGVTVGRNHLYLFVETGKCGSSPAAEFARSGPTGTASGYYVPTASGRFTVPMDFRTSARISDHACAYLTSSSAPKNSNKGVVAHAFKTYKVVPIEAQRAPANGKAALAAEQPPVCFQAFPDAHSTTIGRTTWYNRQRSVQDVICDGFGRNPSADFTTDGVACGLFAVAVGLASDHLGAFVDGACSGVALAAKPKDAATYIETACSWAADLLAGSPEPHAKFIGAVGGALCTLVPPVGNALGGLLESQHELDVARDIMLRGKCLKYSPTHFGSPWLAVDCASSDAGFSTLPRVDNRPAPGGGPSTGSRPAPSGNPNSTGGSPSLPPHEFFVMNASGGVYWRSAPNWSTPQAVAGDGFYPGTIILVSCYQSGASNVPGFADGMWEQASWVAGPGTGHGWINDHFIANGSAINQPSPGIPPCSSSPPPPPPPPPPPTGTLSASNNNGQMAVQVTNFPTGTTYFFCHAGSPSEYPTGGTVTAHASVDITSPNESWASGLCAGGHNTNMWIGFQGADGHDYYSNQVVMEVAASPGASASVSNNNGQMAVQVTNFPTGTTYFFCHAGSPSEYPTGGTVTAHASVDITSPNESWASGLCAGGHNTNMWIGFQGTDGHDYYSNQVTMEVAASPGASDSVFGSNGQMSLQLSNFPQGTNYYFCHAGSPSEYPTGGSIVGHGQLSVTSPNGTYGPLCSGSGNAWIGVQGSDGHDYYSNQITL